MESRAARGAVVEMPMSCGGAVAVIGCVVPGFFLLLPGGGIGHRLGWWQNLVDDVFDGGYDLFDDALWIGAGHPACRPGNGVRRFVDDRADLVLDR